LSSVTVIIALSTRFCFYCYRALPVLLSFPTRRSSDLIGFVVPAADDGDVERIACCLARELKRVHWHPHLFMLGTGRACLLAEHRDRKSTRLNSSHVSISYAVFCLKKKKKEHLIYMI